MGTQRHLRPRKNALVWGAIRDAEPYFCSLLVGQIIWPLGLFLINIWK